jgi:hypothetical protein
MYTDVLVLASVGEVYVRNEYVSRCVVYTGMGWELDGMGGKVQYIYG